LAWIIISSISRWASSDLRGTMAAMPPSGAIRMRRSALSICSGLRFSRPFSMVW
jgi:hypothetical protein